MHFFIFLIFGALFIWWEWLKAPNFNDKLWEGGKSHLKKIRESIFAIWPYLAFCSIWIGVFFFTISIFGSAFHA